MAIDRISKHLRGVKKNQKKTLKRNKPSPIGTQGVEMLDGISMYQSGGYIKEQKPWINQQLLNVSGWWQNNKPQLMKDFPITDFTIGPILDYISGKWDESSSLALIPTLGKIKDLNKISKNFKSEIYLDKANPENYYRVIGNEEGYSDLINSGVVRPNQQGIFKNRSTYYTKGAINDVRNPVVGSGVKKGTVYNGDYIVEVSPNSKHFPTDNHKLNKDWNFGLTYQGNEIPYSSEYLNVYKYNKRVKKYELVPKKQNGGEIKYYESGGSLIEEGNKWRREQYEESLRNKYKQYLQSEAQKGEDAVQKGTTKFAQDYIFPAAKLAGSFTPAGPIIGLSDAYNSYKSGDNIGAIIGAGMEILPYGLSNLSKIKKNIVNPLINNTSWIAENLKYKINDIPRSIEEIREINKIKDRIKNMSVTDVMDLKRSRMLIKNSPDYTKTYNIFSDELNNVTNEFTNKFVSKFANKFHNSDKFIQNYIDNSYYNFDNHRPTQLQYINRIKNPNVKIIDDLLKSTSTVNRIEIGIDNNYNPFETGMSMNHELDHYISYPTIEDSRRFETFINLKNSDPYYHGNYNNNLIIYNPKLGTEIKARLGQIKDLLGISGNQLINKPQLRAGLKVMNNPNNYKLFNNSLDHNKKDFSNQFFINKNIQFFRRVTDINKMLTYMNDVNIDPTLTAHKFGGLINKKQKGGSFLDKLYNAVDPTEPYPNIGRAITLLGNVTFGKQRDTVNVKEPVSEAAWRKRLNKDYDTTMLISNIDGSFRLPKSYENQILVDTNKVQSRIDINEKNLKNNFDSNLYDLIQMDKKYLTDLKEMYNGKSIVANEFSSWKDRKIFVDGKFNPSVISPLNVLHKYTLKYDKDKKKVSYYDIYDFNAFEKFIPGKPFIIKGNVSN